MTRTRRWIVGAGAAALVVAGAAGASAATPQWHPPTYPSAPSGGAQPASGLFRVALAAGSNGKATALYQAVKGAIYATSRSSASGAWGSAQPWQTSAALAGPAVAGGAQGGLAVVAGSKVSALWADTSGRLRTASGSTSSGGTATTVPTPGNVITSIGLLPVPQGLAYSYTAGAGQGTINGGSAPVASSLPAAPVIAQITQGDQAPLQTAVDSSGNQTAAWRQNGAVNVSTRIAGTTTWAAPQAVPGSVDAPFALAVAANGKVALVYTANAVAGSFTGPNASGQSTTVSYTASATLSLRQWPSAGAPIGPPQVLSTYVAAAPTTLAAATSLGLVAFPVAVTAATGGGTLAVGVVTQNGGPGTQPRYLLSRGTIGNALPAPTTLTDPLSGASSWTLVGAATAVDGKGTAGFLVGGQNTQGAQDSVFATTSTSSAPAWKAMKNIAGCTKSEGVAAAPTIVALPTNGVLAAWACQAATSGTSAQKLVGLAAFDTYGPPVVSFTTSGKTIKFTLGETAKYTLTATKGSAKVTGSGSANARQAITRTLNLSSGTWKVTLKATLSSGNSTSQSKNTTVGG